MQAWLIFLWYELTYLVTHMVCLFGFSLRTTGRRHIPRSGPVLVIANHQSYLDPVLIGLSTRRHLVPLARKTLFRNPLFGALIRSLHAVPIDQDGIGIDGLRSILQRLQQGEAVLVFPEGTRTPDGTLQPFKPGVQLLISRAQCPIVPVGIAGAYEAWPLWRKYPILSPLFLPAGAASIAVCVGEPLDGAKYSALPRQQALDDLFQKVADLHQRARQMRRR